MAEEHRPPSATSGKTPLEAGRAILLAANRKKFKFLIPLFLFGAASLCAASAQRPGQSNPSAIALPGDGGHAYAVAAPRYIPQNLPDYQETEIPTATSADTPTEVVVPTETEAPSPTETPFIEITPTILDTPTETPPVSGTETPAPSETETPTPTETETPTPTETETPTPTGTEIIGKEIIGVPDNDNINNAAPITTLPFNLNDFDTIDASTAPGDPYMTCGSGSGQQSASIWFTFTADAYEAITLDTGGSDYDTVVAVWRGDPSDLKQVACSDNDSFTVSLVPGPYYIEVAETGDSGNGGRLEFQVSNAAFQGLRADYFDNIDLLWDPVFTRVDPNVDFNWTGISPAPDVPATEFGVRWTGRVHAQFSEPYTFYVYASDGVRLWVDGQQLIDYWFVQEEPGWQQATIALQAGMDYFIQLEYFQYYDSSVVQLQWSSTSISPAVVIPSAALDYLDVANSTVSAQAKQPVADGADSAAITVTALDSSDHYVVGEPVFLQAGGAGNKINGNSAAPGEWVQIGYTNSVGQAVGYLSSTAAGQKTVLGMVGGLTVGSPVYVTFISGPVNRISVSHIPGFEGAEADADSYYPSISTDGRYAAFLSAASNLSLPEDLAGLRDIFVLDTSNNTLSPAIFSDAGTDTYPSADLEQPEISGDGRFVVFASTAGNLDANCDIGVLSIFVYEVQIGAPGTFTCVSLGLAGDADGPSEHPFISEDGRYVVFASYATNLVAGVADGRKHIYLYDRNTLTTELISSDSDEIPGNAESDYPSVSADGQSVVFQSYADNLIAGDGNFDSDIFLRDRTAGTTARISEALNPLEQPGGASFYPSISSNGNRVAFLSNAANLVTINTYGLWNVFLRDIPSNSTELISVSSSSTGANNDSYYSKISADGYHVVFSSLATNLVAGGGGGIEQIYLRDLEDTETVKISVSAGGEEGDASSSSAWVSGNGTRIVYLSAASNLVPSDLSGWADVFLVERVTPVQAPPNDDFASALAAGPGYSNSESTLGASRASDDPVISCGGSPSQHFNSVWYSIDLAESGSLNLSTVGSSYDTVLAVWTGARGALTEFACDDDSIGQQSTLSLYFDTGTTYWVEVVQKGVQGGGGLVFTVNDADIPPVVVTVWDTSDNPEIGMTVQAYVGETYAGISGVTNDSGEVTFLLDQLTYRFRAVKNGTEFWSGACTPPACSAARITTTIPMLVSVHDANGVDQAGLQVRAFNESDDTGYYGWTNSSGWTEFTLPQGSYRFQTYINGRFFWSGTNNHCTIPGCDLVNISVGYPVTIDVLDFNLDADAGVNVRVYDGEFMTGFVNVTDADGKAFFNLDAGDYHFRANKNGTPFWSNPVDDCVVDSGCNSDYILTNIPVTVTVRDVSNNLQANVWVYAFDDSAWTTLSALTNALGEATFTLPDGSYRFRADKGGHEFWSGPTNHCDMDLPCTSASISVYDSVTVIVRDTNSIADVGVTVRAYNGDLSTAYLAVTDSQGQATILLPEGNYRFRANKNGTPFWSSALNHCTVPNGCTSPIYITTNIRVSVYVRDGDSNLLPNVWVYAFTESGWTNLAVMTDSNGRARFTLPDGNYRFRADRDGQSYWSATTYDCGVPGCMSANITVYNSVTVTVKDRDEKAEVGVYVRAYNGDFPTEYIGLTDAYGVATVYVPNGDYRFRANKNGTVFWSNTANHCTVPACASANIYTNATVTVTVRNGSGAAVPGLYVYPFTGPAWTQLTAQTNASGEATFTLPDSHYWFRADQYGREFWSGTMDHFTVPGDTAATIYVYDTVTVTVRDDAGNYDAGFIVRAFNGDAITPYLAYTNAEGVATLPLVPGDYRFRANKNGTAFWSDTVNHCTVPTCDSANIFTNRPVTVSVRDLSDNAEPNLWVYAFNESFWTGYAARTNSQGEATFTLPDGDYRFRAEKLSFQFWSDAVNHCHVHGCINASIATDDSVTVIVHDTYGAPDNGLTVQAYHDGAFTGYSAVTSGGSAILVLPASSYRFRTTKNGTAFWSSGTDNCIVPNGCSVIDLRTIVTTFPVTVTVHTAGGQPEVGLPVYAYDQDVYTGYSAVTDEYGHAQLTLHYGNYRFMADKAGTQYWSNSVNHCTIAGCTEADITTDGGGFALLMDDFRSITPADVRPNAVQEPVEPPAQRDAQSALTARPAASARPTGGEGEVSSALLFAVPWIVGDGLLYMKNRGRWNGKRKMDSQKRE